MKCPRCGHEIQPGAKFRQGYGASLAHSCSTCGSELPHLCPGQSASFRPSRRSISYLILCKVSKSRWSHSNTTEYTRLIRMQLESPDPGVSLQRIGESLFEKRSDGLPATRMRLHIAVVGRSNGRHLRWTRPSVNQTHGMVLRDNGIVFGQQHQSRCLGQAREAQGIEAVFEQKLCGAIRKAAPSDFDNAVVGRDQNGGCRWPLAGNVGRYAGPRLLPITTTRWAWTPGCELIQS